MHAYLSTNHVISTMKTMVAVLTVHLATKWLTTSAFPERNVIVNNFFRRELALTFQKSVLPSTIKQVYVQVVRSAIRFNQVSAL